MRETLRRTVALLFAGLVLLAIVDGSAHLVLAGVEPTQHPPTAVGSLLMLTTAAGVAISVVAVPFAALAARIWTDEPGLWVDGVLGEEGSHRWSWLVVLVTVVALWGAGRWAIDVLPTAVLVGRILSATALAAAWIIALVVYRFAVHRWPTFATRRAVLAGALFASAFYSVKVHGEFGAPHYLHLAYPILGGLAALTVALVWRRPRPWVERAVVAAGIVFGCASLAAYEPNRSGHSVAVSRTMTAYPAMRLVQMVTDVDGDGHSSLLGGRDCAPFDPSVGPHAEERVGNGVDDNCVGGDAVEGVRDPPSLPVPARRPNVVVVSIDTLRADHVGRVVNGEPLTPRLDEFADEATRFERAYAPSTATTESLPATFFGSLHPQAPQWRPSLAEYLSSHGWQTAALVTLPWIDGPYLRGFDTVDNELGEQVLTGETLISGDDLSRKAVAYLDAYEQSEPLFLWLHYYDPHGPRTPFGKLIDTYGPDPYLHEVHLTDVVVGRMFDHLRALGMWEDSVVVVFSDHGEGLGDHGLETHRWAAWESIIHVPFLVRFPGETARSVSAPVSTVGLQPTLVHWLSGGAADVPGSLLPLVRGSGSAPPVWYRTSWNGPLLFGTVEGGHNVWYDWRRNAFHMHALGDESEELVGTSQFGPFRERLWSQWDRWSVH